MASTDSISVSLMNLRNRILIAMQEEDLGGDFDDQNWQDQMYLAWEHLGYAIKALDKAGDLNE